MLIDKLVEAIKRTLQGEPYQPTDTSLRKYTEEARDLSETSIKIIAFCQTPRKRKEILEEALGLSNQTKNFKVNISPLIDADFIQYTIKDKPNSQHQKYVITTKGKVALFVRNYQDE